MPHGPYSRLQNKSEEHPGTPADAEQLNVVYEALEDTYTTDEVDSAVAEAGTKAGETTGQAVTGVALKHPTEPDTHVETAIGVTAGGRWTDYSIAITEAQLIERGNIGAVKSVNGQTGAVVLTAEDVGAAPATMQGISLDAPDAVQEWWIHPAAVFVATPYPRTLYGGISSDGYITVGEYNHATGQVRRYELEQALRFDLPDDHNPPSIWAADGRRTVVVWTRHNETTHLHIRVSEAGDDLYSLQRSSTLMLNTDKGGTSYTELYRIDHLSDDDNDVFWCFSRLNRYWWGRQQFTVNQDTGTITKNGSSVQIVTTAPDNRQTYCATAEAVNSSGEQVIRMIWGNNPSQVDSSIRYLEINCVTGDVTSPFDGTLTANLDGTNLPISTGDLDPVLDDGEPEIERWIYAVRGGPDDPAIAYAEWDPVDPDNGTYYVAELSGGTIARTHDLGSTGTRVGYDVASNYLPGIAFETPSARRVVLRAASDGTTETLDRVWLTDSGFTEETLLTQATSAGRLIRPKPALNGGPLAAIVTNMTDYSPTTYNDYLGSMRGV